MFNRERKERYIKEKNKEIVIPEYYLRKRFEDSELYEEELQKDVCDFTSYEIVDYYKTLNYTSLEGLAWLNSHFKMYTQWCLQNNLVGDNQNHYLEFDRKALNTCINKFASEKKIINREAILQMVKQLPNPRDQFILLALFEFGKSKDYIDLMEAKVSDISEDDLTMKLYTGRTVQVSPELVRIAKKASEESYYYSMRNDNEYKRKLIDDGHIVKSYPNTKTSSVFQKGRNIYAAIARDLAYLDASFMTANSIVESGKIYTIKKRSKELGMTCEEFMRSEHLEEVNRQYNCVILPSTYLLKYGDLL